MILFALETDEGFLLCMELWRVSVDGLAVVTEMEVVRFVLNSGFCNMILVKLRFVSTPSVLLLFGLAIQGYFNWLPRYGNVNTTKRRLEIGL